MQDDFDEDEMPANYAYVPRGTASLDQMWYESGTEVSIDNVAPIIGEADANKIDQTINDLPAQLPMQVTP